MNVRIKILNLAAGVLAICPLAAQTTYEEMEQLTVNEQVTTVITATEPVQQYNPAETQRGRARGRRSACHRHHRDGTLPHTVRTGLYYPTNGSGNGQRDTRGRDHGLP